MYQSQYTGAEIDESIGKVQDIFVKKTTIVPVEVGGTGQTTIDGLKNMLGIGPGQDILPITNGGTGAATAADARNNLGVAPAVEHKMKSYTTLSQIGLSGAPTMSTILQTMPEGSQLMYTISASRGYTSGTEDENVPSLYGTLHFLKQDNARCLLNFAGVNGERWVGGVDSTTGTFTKWKRVYDSDNAASQIQALLQGGSISVVKSVQRGTITIAGHQTEGSATLGTSVNTSKAVVLYGGQYNSQEFSEEFNPVMLQLSAANKVTATLYALSAYSWQIPYQVIEYY